MHARALQCSYSVARLAAEGGQQRGALDPFADDEEDAAGRSLVLRTGGRTCSISRMSVELQARVQLAPLHLSAEAESRAAGALATGEGASSCSRAGAALARFLEQRRFFEAVQ